jgi:hypothetical protein
MRPPLWFKLAVHAVFLAALLSLPSCVRTVTTCIEASHSRPSADWQRHDSVGASVCVEHGPHD